MSNQESEPDMKLFWGCFIALIATAFGFIVRAQVIGEWGAEFNSRKRNKAKSSESVFALCHQYRHFQSDH